MPEVWTSWATGGCGSLSELAMVSVEVTSRANPSRHFFELQWSKQLY